MSRLPGFVGPSNVNFSVNVDTERTVNYVWEGSGAGIPKVPASFYSRPGLRPWVTIDQGPVRALLTQDDLLWAVSGGLFVEGFASQTAIVRGLVASDGNPATISSNGGADGSGGHQLLIVSGGLGYIYDLVAKTLSPITDTDFPTPALMGGYIDSYFFVLKSQSNQFQISVSEDGTDWDGLDVAQIEQWPGRILSLVVSHNELWPMSATRTNPWYDSGASFPFQPVLGASMQAGILAPWSAVNLDNTLYWLGQTDLGGAQVFLADGYTPKRISTHAVETSIQALGQGASQAIAWTCQMNGHSFYILYLPTNDTHWVYDAASGLWTEWASWNPDPGLWIPHPGRCHAFAFEKHLVGSRANGTIYEQSFDFYNDQLL